VLLLTNGTFFRSFLFGLRRFDAAFFFCFITSRCCGTLRALEVWHKKKSGVKAPQSKESGVKAPQSKESGVKAPSSSRLIFCFA